MDIAIPKLHEIGADSIGELKYLQQVIAFTKQIYNQCIDIQTNPKLLKEFSNDEFTEQLKNS